MTKRGTRFLISTIIGILMIVFTITGYADEGTPPTSDPIGARSRENPVALTLPSTLPDGLAVESSNPGLITPMVVGGNEVTPENAYPWIASLQYYGVHYCGGTLIDAEWILTAAHCWVDANGSTYPITSQDKVVLGEHSLSNPSGREQEIGFSEVHIHPDFNYLTFENDFALLKLSNKATLNEYVNLVSLVSTSSSLVGTSSVIAGWGATYYGGEVVDILRQANVSILADTACSNYGAAFFSGSMLCGGTNDGSKDTCQGDSGGPLVYPDGITWKQVGVTSWGYECGVANYPGVYARIPTALDWIYSVTGIFGKPTIIAPIGTITDPAPAYQWEHVTTATQYRMAIRNSNNVIVLWKTFDAANICSGSLCTANPGNFLSNGDYTVLVQAANSIGKSKWAFANFTVNAVGNFPPGAAMIYYPIGTIADTTPEYEWEHLSNATQYKLAVKNTSGTILIWKIYNAVDICSGAFCKADPGTKLPNGDYTLLILPTNSLGNGTWTGVDFTINSSGAFPPGATVIYSPIGTITDTTPTYQWKHLSTATQYKLAVKDPSKTLVVWKIYNAAAICSASLCTVDPGIVLAPNDYSVWVLATNSYGNGIWTYRYFTIE